MSTRPQRWPCLIGGLCLATAVAQAAEGPGAMLEQKRLLAERLVQSRVGAVVDEARGHLAQAATLAAAGDVKGAEALVDKAMRLAAAAPPPPPSPATEQARYHQLLEQVGQYRADAGKQLDQQRLDALLARAGGAARTGQYGQAARLLESALDLTEAAIVKARDGQTVVHALAFANKQEEYVYEINRHRSYVLLAAQLAQDTHAADIKARVAQFNTEAGRLRMEAEARAAAGDHKTAVAGLEQATRVLIRALQAMGLAVPE